MKKVSNAELKTIVGGLKIINHGRLTTGGSGTFGNPG